MKYYVYAFLFFILLGFGGYYVVNKFINESIVEPPVIAPPIKKEEGFPVKENTTQILLGNDFPKNFVDTVKYEIVDGYTAINWKTLSRVKFEEKYVDSLEMLVPFPFFHQSVKNWDGEPIQINGYVIPIEETGDESILVLSANSFANCFFCGNAGPETIMDIKLKRKLNTRLKQDDRTTFRGKLKLNSTDLYYLNYILEDAELVK